MVQFSALRSHRLQSTTRRKKRSCRGRTRSSPTHPPIRLPRSVFHAGNERPMLSTMAGQHPSQRICKEPTLGLSLFYAHPPIRKWRLDPSRPVAFGLRLGGTLHSPRSRRHDPRRPATAGRMQSRVRHLPTPSPATPVGRSPICRGRRAGIPNHRIVRVREEPSSLRTWQTRICSPGRSVGDAAWRSAHPETGGVLPGIVAREKTFPARPAKRKYP